MRRTSWRAISGRPYFAAISAADAASTLPRHAVAVAAYAPALASDPTPAAPAAAAVVVADGGNQTQDTRSKSGALD